MSLKSCVPILVTLLLISCGKLPDQAEVKAPSIVEDSFTLKKKKGDGSSGGIFENTNQIGIKISSLDKEFLLQGSLITKPFVRRFENLKSRVVAFKVIDNSLYMLEATKGHDLYAKVTKDIILAKFPIVERTANHLFFDFVEGMSDVFMASDWNAQDFSGGAYPSDQWSVAPVDTSFLKSASFDEHNNLVVHQVAQLRSSASDKFPVEVKYYITPYRENPDFKPSVSKLSDFDKMGFFEVTPQLKAGGESVVYASKFDHNKPIVYAISSNTPEEYKEAIRSGVLYWNKAFGKEILKVIDAPEGVEAPNFKYNIIQWVDWKGAGFAYADAQMDPRTGEILHSQIFLTSVFAFSSKGKAEDLLRRIIESKNGEQQGFHRHDHHHHSSYSKNLSLDDYLKANKSSLKKKMKVGLKGFQKKDVMCHFEFSRSMLSGLERMVSSAKDFDEADYLKISRDYVRETVAHEVGHTLGLRHNFAGSLYTNMDVLKKDDVFLEYAKEGKTPENVVTTSSVMEYQNFEESVMTGDQLVSKDEPLDYDLAAIKTLYHGEKFKKSELPPFCTDSHRMTYVDCRVFDSGKSIYKNSLRTENYYMKHLPDMLLQSYVSVKKKIEKGEARSLKEGSFDPSPLISYALSGRGRIVNSFSESSKFLMVHREHDVIGPYDSRDISLEKAAYIKGQIEEVGGVDKLFKGMELSQVQSLRDEFS